MNLEDGLRWIAALDCLRSKYDTTADSVRTEWIALAGSTLHDYELFLANIKWRLPFFYSRWSAEYLKLRLTK